jgi:thiamine biosynthesis lipoprotein
MKSASNKVRRARPLLGTFVEITASGRLDQRSLHAGVDHAFAVIARVQALMSFYDPDSDVSRLNREALRKPVKVDPWTWHVLAMALDFSASSGGIFDVTMASRASDRDKRCKRRSMNGSSWKDIALQSERTVCFSRPLMIDLGGIAKGFAVDCAVDALREIGVGSGVVNAGGDLGVFGTESHSVHLRHPAEPFRIAHSLKIRRCAMATSATYFARPNRSGSGANLIDGRSGKGMKAGSSVTVMADDCLTADALTKVVFACGEHAADVLAHYRADALILARGGSSRWTFEAPCVVRDPNRSD